MRASVLVVVSLLTVSGCGGSTSAPAAPSPAPSGTLASVSGTWTGSAADTSGQEHMTWTLGQNGSAMTGTMIISDAGRSMMGSGSTQGTISGSIVTFRANVPSGGFSGTMSSCSMSMEGQAQISNDGHTMTGTYSGNMSGMMSSMQSCGGAMNNGRFTLTR